MMSKRALVLLIAIALLAGLIVATAPALATPDEPAEVTGGGPVWQPAERLSHTTFGGKLPVIEVGSDGRTVLVAYISQMSADVTDTVPYVRKSTNNGATWASPVAIIPNGPADTRLLDVAMDNNVTHAVWTDLLSGNPNILNIYYARENNNTWPAVTPFSTEIGRAHV